MGGDYLSVSDKLRWVLEWTDLKLNSNLETRTYSHTQLTLPHIHPSPHTPHTHTQKIQWCLPYIHSRGGQIFLYMWAKITQYVRISSFILLLYPPSHISPPSLSITARKLNYVSFNVLVWSNLTVTMRKHWQRQVHLSQNMIPTSHKSGSTVMKSI